MKTVRKHEKIKSNLPNNVFIYFQDDNHYPTCVLLLVAGTCQRKWAQIKKTLIKVNCKFQPFKYYLLQMKSPRQDAATIVFTVVMSSFRPKLQAQTVMSANNYNVSKEDSMIHLRNYTLLPFVCSGYEFRVCYSQRELHVGLHSKQREIMIAHSLLK